jgi:hypothetical protein
VTGATGSNGTTGATGATGAIANDYALQPGFLGYTDPGPITAAVSASNVFTFTNWPTGDTVLFSPGAGLTLLSGIVPAAPSSGGCAISSGQYEYVYAELQAPSSSGGTATVAMHCSGTARTTAALAQGDQISSGLITNNLLVWDGILYDNAGSYSLAAGTASNGGSSTIPNASGRDRRLWARGANAEVSVHAYTATLGYNANALVPLGAALSIRIECSGAPILWHFEGPFQSNNAQNYGLLGMDMDGQPVGANENMSVVQGWVSEVSITSEYTACPAGSHLFQAAWSMGAGVGGSWSINGGGYTIFSVRELLSQSATNGLS